MSNALILTPRVDRSRLANGDEIWVATFVEMPGVVCEGDSEVAARSELIASFDHIRRVTGAKNIGIRTSAVPSWCWSLYEGGETAAEFGPGARRSRPKASLPDSFHETRPLART